MTYGFGSTRTGAAGSSGGILFVSGAKTSSRAREGSNIDFGATLARTSGAVGMPNALSIDCAAVAEPLFSTMAFIAAPNPLGGAKGSDIFCARGATLSVSRADRPAGSAGAARARLSPESLFKLDDFNRRKRASCGSNARSVAPASGAVDSTGSGANSLMSAGFGASAAMLTRPESVFAATSATSSLARETDAFFVSNPLTRLNALALASPSSSPVTSRSPFPSGDVVR
jgi:hypothetical protein